jgi:drug/metabolite transporter (DMT)-like permease
MTAPDTARPGLVDASLLAVAVVWGSTYLVAKELVQPDTVVAVLAIRFLVTVAAMLPFCLHRLRRATREEFCTGVLLGGILASVFAFETFGIAHTSATNAGLIISLTIVITPLAENIVTRSWLPGRFFVAAAGAVAGVLLLASGSELQAPSAGDFLVLVAAVVRAAHIVTMHRRSAGRRHDSFTLTYIQLSVCAVAFCAISPFTGKSIGTVLPELDATAWAKMLYLALVCTVFAFFIQMWSVRLTSPSRVSLLLGTEPIWAMAVGITLGGDRIGVAGVIGAALILGGTNWGRLIERDHRTQPSAAVKNSSRASTEALGSSTSS